VALGALDRPEAAVEAFAKATELDPTNEAVWFNREWRSATSGVMSKRSRHTPRPPSLLCCRFEWPAREGLLEL
jgi:hypothetical protein